MARKRAKQAEPSPQPTADQGVKLRTVWPLATGTPMQIAGSYPNGWTKLRLLADGTITAQHVSGTRLVLPPGTCIYEPMPED